MADAAVDAADRVVDEGFTDGAAFFLGAGALTARDDGFGAGATDPRELSVLVDLVDLELPTAFFKTALFATCFGGLTLLGTAGTPFVTAKCRSNGRPHQRGRPNGTADLTTVIR